MVLTIGTIHGGERFNILPSLVTLTGTVRTLSEKTHTRMPALIRRTAEGVVRGQGGRVELKYEVLGRAVVNDRAMAALARRAAVEIVGETRAIALDAPSMGGEDFSEYLHRAPGCFVYLGTGADARSRRPWHHAAFALHEPAMLTGVRFLVAAARRALRELAR